MITFKSWVQTSDLMKRLEAEYNEDEIEWEKHFKPLDFMTQEIIAIFDHVMDGNKLDIRPEDMHNALHAANYIESSFLLNMLLTKCLMTSKFGKITDLPEFAAMCIAQDPELGKLWFQQMGCTFHIKRVERLWSDKIFWKYSPRTSQVTCWHAMWDSFDVTKPHKSQKQFEWMYDKGMVHLLNMFPLNEELCPVYKLIMDQYSLGRTSLHHVLEPPEWLLRLVQTVPGYLTRKILFRKMRRSLAEFIVLNGHYKLLRTCIDYIPVDTRTAGNQMLMDISVHHETHCFNVLAENGFMPSKAIWRKVVDKATILGYFITNEVHWLTSMPGVPLIPPMIAAHMGNFVASYKHNRYLGHGTNNDRIFTHLRYLYDWNIEKRKENITV
jgi:hypothetical protein